MAISEQHTRSLRMTGSPGASARAGHLRAVEAAASRGCARDAFAMAMVATLPLLTFVLTRQGVSRLEAVGIAVFAGAIVLGWRRGGRAHDAFAAEAWSVGGRAEVATAAVLGRAVRRDDVVVHDVRLPGRRENIDHLVVGTGGVLVVETKRWTGSVVVGRAVRHNWRRRRDVLDQADRLRRSIRRQLRDEHLTVDVFVCIHGARVRPAWFRRRAVVDGIAFGGPRDLARYVRRQKRALRARDVSAVLGQLEVVGAQ